MGSSMLDVVLLSFLFFCMSFSESYTICKMLYLLSSAYPKTLSPPRQLNNLGNVFGIKPLLIGLVPLELLNLFVLVLRILGSDLREGRCCVLRHFGRGLRFSLQSCNLGVLGVQLGLHGGPGIALSNRLRCALYRRNAAVTSCLNLFIFGTFSFGFCCFDFSLLYP